jgi:hypothetical protein
MSKTLLGWVVHGTVPDRKETPKSQQQQVLHHVNLMEEDELTGLNETRECCKELRSLVGKSSEENREDVIKEKQILSDEDKRAEKIFHRTTNKMENCCETGLLRSKTLICQTITVWLNNGYQT